VIGPRDLEPVAGDRLVRRAPRGKQQRSALASGCSGQARPTPRC